jgi:hypothetical protein
MQSLIPEGHYFLPLLAGSFTASWERSRPVDTEIILAMSCLLKFLIILKALYSRYDFDQLRRQASTGVKAFSSSLTEALHIFIRDFETLY